MSDVSTPVILDVARRELASGDRTVRLTEMRCAIIETLATLSRAQSPGWVKRQTLAARIWPAEDRYLPGLSVHIYHLRLLIRDAGIPLAIETAWGGLVRLNAPVEVRRSDLVRIAIPQASFRTLQTMLYAHPDVAAANCVLAAIEGGLSQ